MNILEEKGIVVEPFSFILKCIEKGYIYFDWKNYNNLDNFYVNNPDKILELASGKKWEVKKIITSKYTAQKGEYLVEWWSINGVTGHFARTYVGYNSLQKSVCVTHGTIKSYRVFKEV